MLDIHMFLWESYHYVIKNSSCVFVIFLNNMTYLGFNKDNKPSYVSLNYKTYKQKYYSFIRLLNSFRNKPHKL